MSLIDWETCVSQIILKHYKCCGSIRQGFREDKSVGKDDGCWGEDRNAFLEGVLIKRKSDQQVGRKAVF